MNNAYLRNTFKGMNERGEEFVKTFDSDGATIWSLDIFLQSESKNLVGIFGAVVDTVVNLVGDLLGSSVL